MMRSPLAQAERVLIAPDWLNITLEFVEQARQDLSTVPDPRLDTEVSLPKYVQQYTR